MLYITSETVKKQQLVVWPSEQSPNVDQVISKMKKLQMKSQISRQYTCTRCGKLPPHCHQECPVDEATCYKCLKRGHFSIVCRSTGLVRVNIQRIHKMILIVSWGS